MTLKLTGSKAGLVLQGYFRVERFRGTGRSTTPVRRIHPGRSRPSPQPALQPMWLPPQSQSWVAQSRPGRSTPSAPRPDLLPGKLRGMIGQTKPQPGAGSPWSTASRPGLLPGMVMPWSSMTAQARTHEGVTTTSLPAGQLRLIGEGRALDPGTRQTLETYFQADFSGVRIHEGPAAPALGALAFTLGEAIYFAPGQYRPGTREGLELLGHELTHVVQQRAGRATNPYAQGIAIVQDPALEAEADANGRSVANPLRWIQRKALSSPPAACPQPRAAVLQQMERRREPLSPLNFWSYRESNDLLYIVIVKNDERRFAANVTVCLQELLETKRKVVRNPNNTKTLFEVELDWSRLISIEIQYKKTLQQRGTLHIKFYFDDAYAFEAFTMWSFEESLDKINDNFSEVAKYYRDRSVGSCEQVFSESYPDINTLVVSNIQEFVNTMGALSLPTNKNTYILSESYVEAILRSKSNSK